MLPLGSFGLLYERVGMHVTAQLNTYDKVLHAWVSCFLLKPSAPRNLGLASNL